MLTQRLTRAIGKPVVRVTPFTGGGYSPARRMIVELSDGTTVFAKQAVNKRTAAALRAEHQHLQQLHGSFVPALLGWDDDGVEPVLVLEDLSWAHWPPPWRPELVERVLDTIAEIGRHPVPDGVAPLNDEWLASGWGKVAVDPEPFLSLGMCPPRWLDRALPTLLAAADPVPLKGDQLLHLDVRSDNMCFAGDRTVFVDWNNTCLGNPEVDMAFFLPNMHAEGGPPPEDVLTLDSALIVAVSGFFASEAGGPPVPGGPGVRGIQRQQLEVALPWAVRSLGLPSLGT